MNEWMYLKTSLDKHVQIAEREMMCTSTPQFKLCAEKQREEISGGEEMFLFAVMQSRCFTPPRLLLHPHQAKPAEKWSSTSKSWILLLPCNIQWPLNCENSRLPLAKSWGLAAYDWSLLIYLRKKLAIGRFGTSKIKSRGIIWENRVSGIR